MKHEDQLGEDTRAILQDVLTAHQGMEGPLLPILHAVQAALGHVPEAALPLIAGALNISRAEVHGVMSFYHDFRDHETGRKVVKLCRAEACQAMGANALANQAREKLNIDWHETTQDGAVTLEPVFCLGLCACGPAAMFDGKLVGRLDAAKLDALLGDRR